MKKVLPWLIGTIVIGGGAAATYYFGYLPRTQKEWLVANLQTIIPDLQQSQVSDITTSLMSGGRYDIEQLYKYYHDKNSPLSSYDISQIWNNIGVQGS